MEFDWQQAYARLDRARASAGEPSPEEVARILEERARKLARPVERASAPREILELLVFSLGDERYGIEAARVVEVVPVRALTALPCVPDFVAGVIHHRGRILPVLDLGRFIGFGARGAVETGLVVCLEVDEMTFGVLAEGTTGVVEAPAEDLAPPPRGGEGGGRTFLRGMTSDRVAVLDVGALAADPRLVIDEAAG